MKQFIYAAALLLLCALAQARPVSYPGGITLLQNHNALRNNLNLHYSPTARYSVGVVLEQWQVLDGDFIGLQANHLGKRWNQKQAQANWYIKTAAGVFDQQQTDHAGFVETSIDWENRRYFAEAKLRYSDFGVAHFHAQSIRLGIAPYVADYGSLHTWLMIQTDWNQLLNTPQHTVFLRFFKGTVLTELGANQNGQALFNFAFRF